MTLLPYVRKGLYDSFLWMKNNLNTLHNYFFISILQKLYYLCTKLEEVNKIVYK